VQAVAASLVAFDVQVTTYSLLNLLAVLKLHIKIKQIDYWLYKL